MLLAVPTCRQPDAVQCLPCCVWAVLHYHGHAVAYTDVVAACRLDALGAVYEIAIQGLLDAGWDVATPQVLDLAAIRSLLEDDLPPIVLLSLGTTPVGGLAHAVVVCGMEGGEIVLMDPLGGDYQRLPIWEFEVTLLPCIAGGLVVGAGGR